MREPDVNKGAIGFLAPLSLVARLKQCAESCEMTVSELILYEVNKRYGDVPLKKEWIEWICSQREQNIQRRESRRITRAIKKAINASK